MGIRYKSFGMKGKHHSKSTKLKMSLSRKGKKKPESFRLFMSDFFKNNNPIKIPEVRKKISKTFIKGGEKHPSWKGGISSVYRAKHAPRPKPDNCEICGRTGRICYDHDHKTGKFRGWICSKCNCVLGFVNDDPEILLKIINYLKK